MTQHDRVTIAAWCPGWYELDQPIEIGLTGEFYFWRIIPDYLQGPNDLVFYNTLWHQEEVLVARGTITAIRHPILGAIQKVDPHGLDYAVFLASGARISVEAEENPGKINWIEPSSGSMPDVSDWRLNVELANLSTLHPAE